MHIINQFPENAIKAVSEAQISHDKWHHIAVTYDGSSKAEGVKVYVDGESLKLRTTNNTLTETIRTTVPLKIGSRSSSAIYENAHLQDIKIYSSVIAPDQPSKNIS